MPASSVQHAPAIPRAHSAAGRPTSCTSQGAVSSACMRGCLYECMHCRCNCSALLRRLGGAGTRHNRGTHRYVSIAIRSASLPIMLTAGCSRTQATGGVTQTRLSAHGAPRASPPRTAARRRAGSAARAAVHACAACGATGQGSHRQPAHSPKLPHFFITAVASREVLVEGGTHAARRGDCVNLACMRAALSKHHLLCAAGRLRTHCQLCFKSSHAACLVAGLRAGGRRGP